MEDKSPEMAKQEETMDGSSKDISMRDEGVDKEETTRLDTKTPEVVLETPNDTPPLDNHNQEKEQEGTQDDDDFGDFDDYSTPQPPSKGPVDSEETHIVPEAKPSFVEDDVQERQKLEAFYGSLASKLKRDYSKVKGQYLDALQRAFPLQSKAAATTNTTNSIQGLLAEEYLATNKGNSHGNNQQQALSTATHSQKRLWKPNPKSAGCCHHQTDQQEQADIFTWVKFYDALMGDTVFSMDGGNARFRWRRSQIRKLFLNSLNVEVTEVSFVPGD
jgi:hypothetical protein